MTIIRGTLIEGVAGTFVQATIDTNISIDGKYGWEITGFKAFLATGYTEVTTADWEINAVLSTQVTTATAMSDPEELARIGWANNFTTASVAYPIEPIKTAQMLETRLTVQPQIYVGIDANGTAAVSRIYYEISYDIVKLTELEVMRLLVGGV